MPGYDVLLFDNDGVLVDPPARETQLAAIREAFASVGVDPTDAHAAALAGGVTPDSLHAIADHHDLDPAALWTAREEYDERSQFRTFRAGERGRYDDVDAVTDLTQRCGVVSNNHHSTVAFVLEFFGMEWVEAYYGREKTVESLGLKKPNPHYLERAMADLGGGRALYVGDSENDVVAAQRAGMDSAFVRRDHNHETSLSVAPTYEVGSLHGVARLADAENTP